MKLNPALTKGSARVLRLMVEGDEELVTEGREAYVGTERTSVAVVYRLLREALIRDVSDQDAAVKRYVAHSDAKQALSDPNYETRWREHLRTGKTVHR